MVNNNKKRAIIIVLDSFGIGSLPDAHSFGDVGANTLGSIDQFCSRENINLNIPNLLAMGLNDAFIKLHGYSLKSIQKCSDIAKIATTDCNDSDELNLVAVSNNSANNAYSTKNLDNVNQRHKHLKYLYGYCRELSSGKDTVSGHWEMIGCPVLFQWKVFDKLTDSFDAKLLHDIQQRTNIAGYLGNCHASGTEIIKELGMEHIRTGYPIFYTSADSVFQIACHEEYFGLDRLYDLCKNVRKILDEQHLNVSRVIARPFVGNGLDGFKRTNNRKDYAVPPFKKHLFNFCEEMQGEVIGIGKIADIYADSGISHKIKAFGIDGLCQATIDAMNDFNNDRTIIMTNLVDFDTLYGHRRDILGYKLALEAFDQQLAKIITNLRDGDLLILTADHGCDPAWHGFDHTREYVPLLASYLDKTTEISGQRAFIGERASFSDIGQTIAEFLNIKNNDGLTGQSFMSNKY